MFAYGKHGANAPPAFLPVHAGRMAQCFRIACFAGEYPNTPPAFRNFACGKTSDYATARLKKSGAKTLNFDQWGFDTRLIAVRSTASLAYR